MAPVSAFKQRQFVNATFLHWLVNGYFSSQVSRLALSMRMSLQRLTEKRKERPFHFANDDDDDYS